MLGTHRRLVNDNDNVPVDLLSGDEGELYKFWKLWLAGNDVKCRHK